MVLQCICSRHHLHNLTERDGGRRRLLPERVTSCTKWPTRHYRGSAGYTLKLRVHKDIHFISEEIVHTTQHQHISQQLSGLRITQHTESSITNLLPWSYCLLSVVLHIGSFLPHAKPSGMFCNHTHHQNTQTTHNSHHRILYTREHLSQPLSPFTATYQVQGWRGRG